jgi:Zn-dependent protease with chaperone function
VPDVLSLLPLIHFVSALLLTVILNALVLIPWRRSKRAGAHWSEQARVLFPARRSAQMNLAFIPMLCLVVQVCVLSTDSPVPLWFAAAALPGAILGSYRFDRALYPETGFGKWLQQVTVSWILTMASLSLIWLGIALMPKTWDWRIGAVTGGVLLSRAWLIWGGGLWLCRLLGALAPTPPRLTAIVEKLASRFQIPPPRSWTTQALMANAWALPHTQTLVFTHLLLDHLTDEEVEAITAHEFAHLTESRGALVARTFFQLNFLPWLFVQPMVHTWDLPIAVLVASGISWLWTMCSRHFSTRMERRADTMARGETEDKTTLALALLRIYQVNQIPAVMPGKHLTHPHLYDRMLDAGVTPDFPRPVAAKPTAWTSTVVFLGMLVGAAVIGYNLSLD